VKLINKYPYWSIALISLLLFIPFLGKVHLFDWDEINFAEAAREMLITGNFSSVQINFTTFWEKPPLFFWLQSFSMYLFGINEFGARLPNGLIGAATLMVIYRIGSKLFDKHFGMIWVMVYLGSLLPHFYFKTAIIDPTYNLLIILGVYYLSKLTGQKDIPTNRTIAFSGIFIGLAVLTKGPVAILIMALSIVVLYIINRKRIFTPKRFLIWGSVIIVISFGWYGFDLIRNGPSFLLDFYNYHVRLLTTEDAGHGGPFYYHLIVLLLGCFPASIFAISAFQKQEDGQWQQVFKQWMIVLGTVTLVVFSMVNTKIIHYSSLCYFPITFLGGYFLFKSRNNGIRSYPVTVWLFAIVGSILAILITMLPLVGKHQEMLTPFIKDEFAIANLMADVKWYYWEVVIGLLYLTAIIYGVRAYFLHQYRKGAVATFISTIIILQLVMTLFVPKIERYTQGAAIDFYKTLTKEDCYVDVLGFKSYAHLFYTGKRNPENRQSLDKEWLLHGKIDKPVYFVTRIDRLQSLDVSHLNEIARKNGFVFLKRETEKNEAPVK